MYFAFACSNSGLLSSEIAPCALNARSKSSSKTRAAAATNDFDDVQPHRLGIRLAFGLGHRFSNLRGDLFHVDPHLAAPPNLHRSDGHLHLELTRIR
jgi:hypothetical protein